MLVAFSDNFNKQAKKLFKKNPKLRDVFAKQFQTFSVSPRSSSLRLHKLSGSRSTQFAISLTGDLRAIAVKYEAMYLFIEIANHDSY